MIQGLILNPIFIPGVTYGFTTKFLPNTTHKYVKTNPDIAQSVIDNNLASLADSLSVNTNKLCFIHQIHSNIVVDRFDQGDELIQADGHFTNNKELVLTVQTADCVPILFYDSVNHTIASVHAGWRGAKTDIISNIIKKMIEHGSQSNNIIAIIGPHINQANYEIGDEFKSDFIKENSEFEKYFAKLSAQYHFDLGQFVIDKLNQFNLKQIIKYNHDTFSNDYWFSFRRFSKKIDPQYGSIISFIKLS